MIEGHCLCGAVTIRAEHHTPEVSACHCEMCRRWTGGVYVMFKAPAVGTMIDGPVATYRSSPFAQRAFCGTCGSPLWLRDDDDPDYELMPGLFEAARDFPLTSEVYADRAMTCLRLSGDHTRTTRAAYEAAHPHVAEDVR